MRDIQLLAAAPRPRRRGLLLRTAVMAAFLLSPATASAAIRNVEPAADPTASATAPCTRTVGGFTASAVASARDRAGRGGIVCFPAGTYRGSLTASVPDQTWRLADAATVIGSVRITAAGVKFINGIIANPTTNRWIPSVEIRAHDVTVQSVMFRGGGTGINVYGKDRSRIISNSFRYQTGSAVSIWSEGVGADYTLIYMNSIVQSKTYRVSPITSRGNESSSHGGVQNYRSNIRLNSINQGAGDIGWFGIELKQSRGSIIEKNSIKGGKVLVSLPETDGARIRYNTFDLRGTPFWGIEVGNAHDAVIDANTFVGDGPGGKDYAISLNSGSLRTLARSNKATNLRTFFGVAGDGHRVTDNCLVNVRHVQEFMLNGGPNIVFARNRGC